MPATARFEMTDVSRQKRLSIEIGRELTPRHTVDQAVQLFLERMDIPDNGLRWTAFSRGALLDKKQPLSQIDEAEERWTVMPEVSAGTS